MTVIRATIVLAVLGLLAMPASAEPEIGQKAPPFELQGSDGELYTLERFAGKQAVVLAWFPKAFTPG